MLLVCKETHLTMLMMTIVMVVVTWLMPVTIKRHLKAELFSHIHLCFFDLFVCPPSFCVSLGS